jgi:hypothetical protein
MCNAHQRKRVRNLALMHAMPTFTGKIQCSGRTSTLQRTQIQIFTAQTHAQTHTHTHTHTHTKEDTARTLVSKLKNNVRSTLSVNCQEHGASGICKETGHGQGICNACACVHGKPTVHKYYGACTHSTRWILWHKLHGFHVIIFY